ncbi:SGNH/GDSL hydrolase family protein [Trinickia violacea]|uniref:SGNH/GDSL hydrolase family protein n=1 Tax=Trinickia violacea TaxID=2571746 RepID=A0A4P8IT52_9BURK|nr:SGNH/GDSL hydrolase family protein [Trinickia violacea]QCP51287.1 SGNH/GDSL hydrolase family protein [Trinickia violacea]
MTFRFRKFIALGATLFGAALFSQLPAIPCAVAADAPSHWVTSWATALQPIPNRADLPPLYRAPEVAARTVRQIVFPTLSGRGVRVHISNAYGREPLVLEDVQIAQSAGGAALRAGSSMQVTFGGRKSVAVPPGGELDSDPVAMEVSAGAPYVISSYMGQQQTLTVWHRVSNQVNYVSTAGNHAADAGADAYRTKFTQYAWVTALTVDAPSSAAIAAIGDSITDGMRSSLNRNQRWPDAFSRRLAESGKGSTSILNLGISGNRLLSDSPCYGDALVRRFDRDVLAHPGVKAVVLLIGINDINFPAMPPRAGLDCDFPHTPVTAQSLIAGYQQVIAAAHRHGLRIFGATLTPASLPRDREEIRLAVNRWIRTSGAFDGVVDFDGAVRDPARPDRLLPRYDSGDHIHPSDVGYAAMAEAVPLAAVTEAAHR